MNSLHGVYLSFVAKRVLTNGRTKKGRDECMEGGISATGVIKNPGEAEIQSKRQPGIYKPTNLENRWAENQKTRLFFLDGDLRKNIFA